MSYDPSAQALRCPFCGSSNLSAQKDQRTLAPRRIIPFRINHDEAVARMRKWLGSSFWRPSDLASNASIHSISAVYVPFWVFQATTLTYWTADSSATPPMARGDWVPVSGRHRGSYAGLLIGASSVLTPEETRTICPYDLASGVAPDQVSRDGVVLEQFRVQRKYARPLAKQGLETMEANACHQYVAGNVRNMKVNVRLKDLHSEPVMLPVWIMAYRYGDHLYRFLVNGQTGQATGSAPWSWFKLAILVAGGVGIVVLLIILALILGNV